MSPGASSTDHLGGLWQSCCQAIPGVRLTSSPNLSTHLLEVDQAGLPRLVLLADET